MQNKLIWLTDPHLNHIDLPSNKLMLLKVCQQVNPGDSVVVTGDISDGESGQVFMEAWKKGIEDRGGCLYFVLGNHDYYNNSIEKMRARAREKLPTCWLPEVGLAKLNNDWAIVGHDGWYDGLYANWYQSKVQMNDYYIIQELNHMQSPRMQDKFKKIQELSREGADHVYKWAKQAAGSYLNVVIATHVPPFPENSVYNGKISDKDWLPHFSSKHMGDALLRIAYECPRTNFVLLCGHSHGEAVHRPADNLTCYTGFAQYGHPQVAKVFTLT